MLIVLAVAWMAGLVAADLFAPPLTVAVTLFVTGLAAAGLAYQRPYYRLAGLALCCAALALWRYDAARIPTTPVSVWNLAGHGDVLIEGVISGDPRRTDEGQQLVLSVYAARVEDAVLQVDGQVLVQAPTYPVYTYGQRLQVLGELRRPRPAAKPGQFDYQAYLARKGIFVLVREPQITLLPGNSGIAPLRALLAARDHCRTVMLRLLPEPQASLAIGILLGLQSSIPPDIYGAFSVTGTSHVLVVSGWNFTIVAAILTGLTTRLRLGRAGAFWSALVVMWVYALFVGASAAVLRAAAMASLMVLARATERRSEPWRLLFAACWLISLHDPNTLWDLGFQLSALATASLFAFGKPVEAWLQRFPPMRISWLGWAVEALTATLAAQILALPIILYQFGNLSIVAPLANVLLVPVVPYIMLFSTIALVAGLLWLPLGQWSALVAWLPLTWLADGALLLARVPAAAVALPPFPLWLLLGYYVLLAAWYLLRGKNLVNELSPDGTKGS